MFRNLVAAWSIPDVRARIVYVFMMIALFVVGLHIPVPGVNLGALDFPDLVAEVADLILPYDRARWVVCIGHHEGVVYLSVRTDRENAKAGSLIRRVVGKEGAAGGHGMIAGGRMKKEVHSDKELKAVYDELVARLMKELAIDGEPTPLV